MTDRICSIEGCTSKRLSRGLCSKHYRRVKLYGDPDAYFPNAQPKNCSISGCNNQKTARGFCDSHYAKWKRYGDPLTENRRHGTPEEAFMARTKRQGECLTWTGAKCDKGYGTMWNGRVVQRAHRYAWERVNGRLTPDQEIDHVCHNRACVEVKHLRIVGRGENSSYRSGPSSNSTTGLRNVSKVGNKWRVEVMKDWVSHYLGQFDTPEEAAAVAEQARKDLFGDYAGRG